MSFSLENRTALITGANQGLGKAIAHAFVLAGANVFLCARDELKLAEVQSELKGFCKTGQRAEAMRADVSKRDDVDRLVSAALASFPRIHILVNNAGIYGPKGSIEQVDVISTALNNHVPSYISVFAGRIADTGVDPMPLMKAAVKIMSRFDKQELIWASPRELLNIFHAEETGCHVITVTHDILKKLSLMGKSLDEYSLETVKMFHDDAVKAGFSL